MNSAGSDALNDLDDVKINSLAKIDKKTRKLGEI